MTVPPPAPESAAEPGTPGAPEQGSTPLFWLGAIAIGAVAGLLAAHAPARIRLLGLFSAGFGLLIGWSITRLAARLRIRPDASIAVLAPLATLAGLVICLCRTVSLQPAPAGSLPHPIAAIVAEQMRKSGSPGAEADPTGPATPIPTRTFAARVQSYLNRRLEMLGDWPTPWPELFWAGEVLLGMAGAAWMGIRIRQREPVA